MASMACELLFHNVHNVMYAFGRLSINLKISAQVICYNQVVLFSERKDLHTPTLSHGRDGGVCNKKVLLLSKFHTFNTLRILQLAA